MVSCEGFEGQGRLGTYPHITEDPQSMTQMPMQQMKQPQVPTSPTGGPRTGTAKYPYKAENADELTFSVRMSCFGISF